MFDPEADPLKASSRSTSPRCLSVPTKRSSRSPSPAKCSSLARSRSSITQSRRNPRDLVRSILTRCPAAGRDPEQRGDAHPRVHQGKHCAGHDTGGHASYLGLYRHDPRGSMAGHVPLKWILRPLEAVEPRHLPSPPTHRFVPERIRLPLQPTILSTCLFETVLGLVTRHGPVAYWDIIERKNPRKASPTIRRQPRHRKTA